MLSSLPSPLKSRVQPDSYQWRPRHYPPPPIASSVSHPSTVDYKDQGFGLQVRKANPTGQLEIYPPIPVYGDKASTTAANHRPDGYVELGDGQAYSLRLTNNHGSPCDATLTVDDEDIGTFRIKGYGQIDIDGPPNDGRRFTFYKAGTWKGRAAGIENGVASNGVISVTFIPAYPTKGAILLNYADSDGVAEEGYETYSCQVSHQTNGYEGATGLHGHTDQRFKQVADLDLDHSRKCTIACRLIGVDDFKKGPVKDLEPYPKSYWW